MPSVTAAKLKQLEDELVEQRERAVLNYDDAKRGEQRISRFNTILDKIARAADGRPLTDDRNIGGNYAQFGGTVYDGPPRKIKTEERQAEEIRALNERIINLEARLAAVKAVATFAQAHKD